jgi:hypothetical protein
MGYGHNAPDSQNVPAFTLTPAAEGEGYRLLAIAGEEVCPKSLVLPAGES